MVFGNGYRCWFVHFGPCMPLYMLRRLEHTTTRLIRYAYRQSLFKTALTFSITSLSSSPLT